MLDDSLRRLCGGRTVITIAHRLHTVIDADQILVLAEGHLVEQGTHSTLLALDGEYARLFRSNALFVAEGPVTPGNPSAPAQSDRPGTYSPFTTVPVPPVSVSTRPSVPDGKQIRPKMSIVRRLLGFVRGEWAWVWLAALLGSLTIGSAVGLMGVSAWLISTAAMHPSIAVLGVAIAGVRFFGIARAAFRYMERLASHSVTFRVLRNIRVWFYERLEPLAPALLMDRKSGDLLARAIADVETLENLYVRLLAPPATAALVAGGTYMFFASIGLTQIAILVTTFLVLAGALLPLLTQRLSRRAGHEEITVRGELYAELVDSIQGSADILAFGQVADRVQRMAAIGSKYADAQRRISQVAGLQAGLANFLPNLAVWLVLLMITPQVRAGTLDGVMLAPVALVAMAVFEAAPPLQAAGGLWQATRQAAKRLFEIADTRPSVAERPEAGTAVKQPAHARRDGPQAPGLALEFGDVTFRYPGQAAPALKHVSFELPRGKSLGIVGPSGAGKSSIAHLVLQFWDYDSGEIRLGAVSLKDLAPDEVRTQIGFVSTEAHFFDTSIYENLRLARRGVTRPEIELAARKADIHEFICSLPSGYDTPVGEHGLLLSAGERQRLALARLLIKDAPFWILDEPTAHLDMATESLVLASLFGAMRDRTVLFITHRLVGLQNLDDLLVLAGGQVVERGPHQELARHAGLYHRLWSLQGHVVPQSQT